MEFFWRGNWRNRRVGLRGIVFHSKLKQLFRRPFYAVFQRLADFFDANTITNRLQTAVDKLAALQNADGSFSWYPGMEGSTYITVAVEEMLARLQSLGCKWPTEAPSALYDKAFNFMAKEMVEQVSKMKKEEKKGCRQTFPSFTALRWLYLCAIDGRILKTDVKAANESVFI